MKIYVTATKWTKNERYIYVCASKKVAEKVHAITKAKSGFHDVRISKYRPKGIKIKKAGKPYRFENRTYYTIIVEED